MNLDDLKTNFPDLKTLSIYINEGLSSAVENYREKLREALYVELGSTDPTLLDLDKLPESEKLSISLSHCPFASGWAMIEKPRLVGFDIESPDRIKENIVARMSNRDEMKQAPHYKHLWTAKEAAFKALNQSLNLKTISKLQFSNWDEPVERWLTADCYFANSKIPGKAFSHQYSDSYLSFFIKS